MPLGGYVVAVAWLTVVVAGALAVGSWTLTLFRLAGLDRLQRICVSLAVGFLLMGYLCLALGSVGLARPDALTSLALLCAAPTVWRLALNTRGGPLTVRLLCRAASRASMINARRWSAWQWVPLGFLGLSALLTFAVALTPCTSYDAHTYHLSLPQLWLTRGNTHLHGVTRCELYPLNVEMLHMLGLALAGEPLANLIDWALFLLALTTLFAFARQWLSREAALWTTAIFAAVPQVTLQAGGGGNDVPTALYVFLMGCLIERWLRTDRTQDLVAAGGFAGAVFATKLTAPVFLLASGCTVAAVAAYRSAQTCRQASYGARRWGRLYSTFSGGVRWVPTCLGRLTPFGGAFLCTAAPWLIRNAVWTHNPIYPALSHLLPTTVPVLICPVFSPGFERSLANLLTLPVRQALDFRFVDGWQNALPPYFLLLLPFVGWAPRRWGLPKILLSQALAAYGIMSLLVPAQPRYALPMYPWLALAAAGTLLSLAGRAGRWQRSALLVGASLPLLVVLAMAGGRLALRVPVLLGRESRESFLAKRIQGWTMFRYVDEHLPRNARVLNVDKNFYYLPRACWVASPSLQSPLFPLWSATEPEIGWETWKHLGVTHVLISPTPLNAKIRAGLLPEVDRVDGVGSTALARGDILAHRNTPSDERPGAHLREGNRARVAASPGSASAPSLPWGIAPLQREADAGIAASLRLAARQGCLRLVRQTTDGWWLFEWSPPVQPLKLANNRFFSQ